MKIRTGFVSNSSAASFVVSFLGDRKEFMGFIKRSEHDGGVYCYFLYPFKFDTIKEIKEEIRNELHEEFKDIKREHLLKRPDDLDPYTEYYNRFILREIRNQFISVRGINSINELLDFYLKYKYDISLYDEGSTIKFRWYTEMLNDLSGSCPELITELVLLEKTIGKTFLSKIEYERV